MRLMAVMLLGGCLAGCGGGADAGAPPETAAATPAPDPCHRPARPVRAPKGLVIPEGTLVAKITERPPNKQVEGFVALAPDRFVEFMARREGIGILFREAEGRDAEVMVTDGRQRSFWKLRTACPEGSRFTVLTGAEPAPAAARKAIRSG
jgi:hypothetical protein